MSKEMIILLIDRAKDGYPLNVPGLAYINAGIKGWSTDTANTFIKALDETANLSRFISRADVDKLTQGSDSEVTALIVHKIVHKAALSVNDIAYLDASNLSWFEEHREEIINAAFNNNTLEELLDVLN
jgi:hypothetical protein